MKVLLSTEQKRALLDSAKGQFFSVKFIKKDKTIRDMTAKKFIKAYLHGEVGQNVNTCAAKPEIYTVAEMDVEGFRNINLDSLLEAKVAGVKYEFINEV